MKNKPIIIIPADNKSVFFEIFFKSIKYKKFNSPLILICSNQKIKKQMEMFNIKKTIRLLKINELKKIKLDNTKINIIDINDKDYLHKCFQTAFMLIKNKFTHKFINGPVNKKNFLKKKYQGITEYIAEKFNCKKFGMLIYNENLSVSPLTTHLPIKFVTKKINKKIIEEKIIIINNFFKNYLNIKPRIGVTGLNPHCETIDKFNEDEKIVSLAIKSSIKRKINVKGPYPADTIFLKNNRKKFDVILGMYHDQVLTPAKTLFEYNAINITMGLPFLRVSPDHGPNENMYGKNKSNPLSLIKAIEFLDQR